MSSKQESNKDNSGLDGTNASVDNSKESYTIGHYVLGKALGEGTFGKVLLGTHKLTQEKVAVKVLEKSRIKDKKDVERISREIKILKQLHHPNVVQIYEIIETEKELYLVMEFVSDGELFDLIVQHQRLKEKTACKYFQELISGINYIHQLGICHRDLKPENLLVDYDKTLKIVDFGLSNLYEKGETLKTACGSPCYAAPEMIAGKRYNGLMSDLWSVGVVLYAMLCGYLPFEDQKTSDLYKKILSADYTLPDFLSPEAQDILKQIFQTDPDKRISVEQIRKHPWYQINKPETISFHICPPELQKLRSNIIKKGNKDYQIIQRPNLLNQKIVSNLETQQGFNRESLLKSIKNNKHNHLTATYYLLLKKHMIRHLKPYTDAFMELKPYDASQEQVKIENQRAIQQAPTVKLQSNDVKQALNTKNSKNSIKKNFESIDHTKITGEVKYNEREVKQNNFMPSNQKQEIEPEKKIDFTNQTQQQFKDKKQTTKAKTAFHHRREQSANPNVSAKNGGNNIEMYQDQVEQYKKENERKQKDERNSRWKTNNAKSGDNSERNQVINGHKRAESYNVGGQKKDNYDMINEGKEEEKINLQYIQSKNIKHTNKGDKNELRAPSTGSNGSQPRVQAHGQQSNNSGSGTISISQSGAQRRYDSIEHQRQSQINKFLQSPTEQISHMMKNKNGSNYQTANDRYSKTKHNFTASQKENSRKQPDTIDEHNLGPRMQISSNSSVPNNMVQNSKTINEQNINIKNVLKQNNSSSIKQSQIRNSSNHNKNNTNETTGSSSKDQSQEYYNQLQLQLAMLNKRKQILVSQNNQNDQSYIDSLNNEQQKVLLQMQKIQSSYHSQQQQSSGSNGHRKTNSQMMQQNGINLENQKVQNVKQDSQNIRHLIHQINNTQTTNVIKGQNGLVINGMQDTTQFKAQQNNQQKGGQPTALTMPSAPKSGNVLKLKPQVIKQSKSSQKHNDNSQALGSTQTSNINNQKQIAAQQFQMQQQYTSQQQQQKKKPIAHTTKNMGNTQQIAHNFDIEQNSGHVQSIDDNKRKQNNFVTTPSNISKTSSKNAEITTNLSQNDYIQSLIFEYEKQQSTQQSSINSQVKILGQQGATTDKRGIIKVNNYKPSNKGQNVRQSSKHKEGTIAYEDKDKQYKDSINNSSRRKSSNQNQSNQTSQRRKNNYKVDENGYGSTLQQTNFHTQDNRKNQSDPKQMIIVKQNSNQNSDGAVYQQTHSSMTANNEIHSNNQYQLEQKSNNRQPLSGHAKIKSGSSTLQPHSTVQHASRKDPNIQTTMAQPSNNHFGNINQDGQQRGRSANAHDRERETYNQNQNQMKMSIMSKYNQQPSTQQVKGRNYSAPRDREAFDKSKIEQEIYRQQLLNQSVEINQNLKNEGQRKGTANQFEQININLGQLGQSIHNSTSSNNKQIHGHRHSMGNTADISNLMKTQGTLHQKHYSQIGPPQGHSYNNFDDENDRYYQSQIQNSSSTPNQYQQTKYQQILNQNQKTPTTQKRTDKRKQQQSYNYPQNEASRDKPKKDERYGERSGERAAGIDNYRSGGGTRNSGQNIKEHSKSHNAQQQREPINVSLNVQTNIQQHIHKYVGTVNQYDGPVSQNGNVTYVYKN